jgi:ketosteroid isomerase-like protein
MKAYWNSDSLKFIGKNGVTFGWKNTLANYKKNYPDKEAMGTLSFSLTSVDVLSENVCYVIGSWSLIKKKGSVAGFYTLLWKKINGQWVITIDHTS